MNMNIDPQLHHQALVWDAHGCFPLNPNSDLSQLKRYKESGVNFLSLNIGMDMDEVSQIFQILARFRNYLLAHPEAYSLVQTVQDITAAQETNKLAVAFDLEGSEPLLGNLNMIPLYYDLGVRQMLLAYNQDNLAAGGCLEGKYGLTDFGRAVIQEMNRVGMIVDLSHMGYAATLEACEISTAPVIFSHSNPNGIRAHDRNIEDEQIRACAQTGGVVGINGVGVFLGDIRSETFVTHIEYVMELVGPQHVGIGLDFVVDKGEILDYIERFPERFPKHNKEDYLAFVEPEQITEIVGLLLQRGHNEEVIRGVLGENFLRVAEEVWK